MFRWEPQECHFTCRWCHLRLRWLVLWSYPLLQYCMIHVILFCKKNKGPYSQKQDNFSPPLFQDNWRLFTFYNSCFYSWYLEKVLWNKHVFTYNYFSQYSVFSATKIPCAQNKRRTDASLWSQTYSWTKVIPLLRIGANVFMCAGSK